MMMMTSDEEDTPKLSSSFEIYNPEENSLGLVCQNLSYDKPIYFIISKQGCPCCSTVFNLLLKIIKSAANKSTQRIVKTSGGYLSEVLLNPNIKDTEKIRIVLEHQDKREIIDILMDKLNGNEDGKYEQNGIVFKRNTNIPICKPTYPCIFKLNTSNEYMLLNGGKDNFLLNIAKNLIKNNGNGRDISQFINLINGLLNDWKGIPNDFKEKTLKSIIESLFIPNINEPLWVDMAYQKEKEFRLI